MKYSLIVSDFDNTLANSQRKVSERTKKAIFDYQQAGGKFIICTGRMYPSARTEATALGLKGEIICYNGALIGDIESDKASYRALIKKEVAQDLVREFEERDDVVVQLYFDDKIFVRYDNPYTREYCKECKLPFYETKISLLDFLKGQDKDVIEVLVMASGEKILEMYREYLQKDSKEYTVVSSEVHFLEFLSPNANKGKALRSYCEQNGINPETVACFGDNYNDIFMIEYAGLGVAVENGVDEIKQKADLVCPSNDDDGVAQIIEKIIKGEI